MTAEDFLLGVIVGAGLMVIALRLVPRALRAWGVHVRKSQADWQDEVERTAIACLHADLESARTKARLVELIGEIPKEFDPAVFLGCSIAAGVQRAVLQRAEEEGLIPAGMIERVFVEPEPAKAEPVDLPGPSNIRRLPSGRVVPKRAGDG